MCFKRGNAGAVRLPVVAITSVAIFLAITIGILRMVARQIEIVEIKEMPRDGFEKLYLEEMEPVSAPEEIEKKPLKQREVKEVMLEDLSFEELPVVVEKEGLKAEHDIYPSAEDLKILQEKKAIIY